jgi:phosphatidylglycerophosphate synthase
VRLAPQHVLSFSRVVLGTHVLIELGSADKSATVLPAVALACLADYADGIVARRAAAESTAGRLVDNLCDAAFLALAFCGFAAAGVWSTPLEPIASRWRQLDWLPLVALVASFGTYLVRWYAACTRGVTPRPSPRGHHAGIANYVLAIVGGVAAFPGVALASWLTAAAFIVVVSLNLVAAADNARLLAAGESDAVRSA